MDTNDTFVQAHINIILIGLVGFYLSVISGLFFADLLLVYLSVLFVIIIFIVCQLLFLKNRWATIVNVGLLMVYIVMLHNTPSRTHPNILPWQNAMMLLLGISFCHSLYLTKQLKLTLHKIFYMFAVLSYLLFGLLFVLGTMT